MNLQEQKEYFEEILNKISYSRHGGTWSLKLHLDGTRYYLQVHCTGIPGATDPDDGPWTGRKWLLSPYMVRSEIIRTAYKAVIAAEEHEIQEKFKYRDCTVMGPHMHMDELVELIQAKKLHDETRKNGMLG